MQGIGKKNSYRIAGKKGKWTYWYENGQKKEEGTYEWDKKYAIWTAWNKQGKITSETDYKINGDKKILESVFLF